jgi:hypothetical protein
MVTERAGLRAYWMNSAGAPRDPDARAALDIGTRAAPQVDRFRIAADLHADLLEEPVGMCLDRHQLLFLQHLVGRRGSRDEGCRRRMGGA